MNVIKRHTSRSWVLMPVLVFVIGVIGLAFLQSGQVQATTLPVIYKTGTLAANETWNDASVYMISSSLTVPDDVTLTINPGTIVKYTVGSEIVIAAGGSLVAEGTNEEGITFTSYKDDSFGGDSNEDGESAGSYGDGGGYAITNNGGTVQVAHSLIRYQNYAVYINCTNTAGSTLLTDNSFASTVVMSDCPSGAISMLRNSFAVPDNVGNFAVEVGYSAAEGIVLAGADKNSFNSAGSGNVVRLFGAFVAPGSTWSVSGLSGAVLLAPMPFTVDGTMNVTDGAVIKYSSGGSTVVASTGELNVTGSSSNKVIFTSSKDDSVGGDSNGDGNSTGAFGDSGSTAIQNNGGNVNVSHAAVRNGNYAVGVNCSPSQGSTILSDNTFNNTVYLNGCNHGSVTIVRNTFAIPDDTWFSAIDMQWSAAESIAMSGVNKNTFLGNGQGKIVELYQSNVPAGQTWSVDSTTGAVINSRDLEVNGTLNLGQGTILKVTSPSNGVKVNEGGILNVNGSPTDPVVITSIKDDSRGGDSNGDGGSSTATQASYNAALSVYGGDVTVSHAQIYYSGVGIDQAGDSSIHATDVEIESANSGIGVSGGKALFNNTNVAHVDNGMSVSGGIVTYRGSFDDVSERAVWSCNWGSEDVCSVDAAYTAWGSIYGPFGATANEDLTCGAVTVTPWVHNNTTYDTSPLFNVRNCDNSPTPAEELASAAAAHSQRLAQQQIDCDNGFQDACNAINSVFACLTGAIDVAASTTPFPLPSSSATEQAATYAGDTLNVASTYINGEETSSPTAFGLSFASKLYSVADTIRSLTNAYGACAP